MSWSGLASNQCVSYNNLQDAVTTGVFALKNSIPVSSKQITKAQAENCVYINSVAGKSATQLIVKSNLVPYTVGPGPYNYYVYGVSSNYFYKSTNGGFTFAQKYYNASGNLSAVAANYSGQYIALGSNYQDNLIYISNDYGVSFHTVSITGVCSVCTFQNFWVLDIDMSSSGQYMAVVGKNFSGSTSGYITVAVSTDYGVSFNLYTTYQAKLATHASVSVSADGSAITYVAADYFGHPGYDSWIYTSTTSGSIFTFRGVSTNQLFNDVAVSGNGQYQVIINRGTSSTGNIFVSSDYGLNFLDKAVVGYPFCCSINDQGFNMTVGISQVGGATVLYSSNNYGANFYDVGSGAGTYTNGVATSTDGTLPTIPYSASFSANQCYYWPNNSVATYYDQPSTTILFNKVYRRAIPY